MPNKLEKWAFEPVTEGRLPATELDEEGSSGDFDRCAQRLRIEGGNE